MTWLVNCVVCVRVFSGSVRSCEGRGDFDLAFKSGELCYDNGEGAEMLAGLPKDTDQATVSAP